jgi:Alpha/beta hydrolase domain
MSQLFKHLSLGDQVAARLVLISTSRSQYCIGSVIFSIFLIAIATFGLAPPSYAEVTQINITCVQSPTFGGASFGSVGQYELIQGTFTGEVDPVNPQNAVIVDIQNAPRNAKGMVTYSADFQIFRPINLSLGNHRVIYDLPNRGGATALSTYNNGTGNDRSWCTTGLPAKFTVGDGFLMNEGFTVVDTAWDITVTPSGSSSASSFGVSFPVATHRDGTVITGPATEEFVIDFTATATTEPLHYAAATADQSKATLTVRENYGDKPIVIPSSGWAYTDSTLTAIKLANGLLFGGAGTYSPTALYEFTYIAENPLVAGLGFASLRDFATFLRTAKTDDSGVANPLAGDVKGIYTTCVSQPCRTTHDFVLLGFNQRESKFARGRGAWSENNWRTNQPVFDGMINWIGGGDGIYMNYRFAQPTRTSRQHIARWDPEFQFPWANQALYDPVTGQYGGRLDACSRTDTCPKIFELNSENEYYSKGGSMLTTDTEGHDLDLHATPNVRYYQLASVPHGAGTAAGICREPQNPLNASTTLRALTIDMDEWVTHGTQPPSNRVPTRSSGTLVPSLPQLGMGFPIIPGVFYNGIMHTGDLFDFGPRFHEGILDIQPPVLLGTPYRVFVPKTDADGNDIAGIRLPDISVPLATYTGYAYRAPVAGDPVPMVDGCDASGQRIPFLETQAERIAAGDPRLSIQERYPDHATYVNLVTAAAQQLQAERLMLDADVQAYIAAAQAASVP